MILLLQSALRALLLGAAVWALLRLLKLRDARSETAAWTLVLAAALAMPLLTPLLERWLPGTQLPLPQASLAAPGIGAAPLAPVRGWLAVHAAALLWLAYATGTAAMLARLATGLILSQRLYRRTMPLADGLRIGAAVRSPMVFGRTILLPLAWQSWPEAKQAAVLAHERCHVARGDFFLQLAASLYRAFFWFSPFAWWLQRELSALAERDSDAAAVRLMGDRARYAELLVEAACHAQGLPALVAMAKGPGIAWRVERILTEGVTEPTPSIRRRIFAAACMLAASLGFAGAHAAVPLETAARPTPIAQAATPTRIAAQSAPGVAIPHPAPRPASRRHAAAPATMAAPAPAPEPEFTYNPRALLDGPTVAVLPGALLVTQQ
jgi:beta-lactamase regulating signal transducer with metallopeptidase domain